MGKSEDTLWAVLRDLEYIRCEINTEKPELGAVSLSLSVVEGRIMARLKEYFDERA
jgi:hypothetical protein